MKKVSLRELHGTIPKENEPILALARDFSFNFDSYPDAPTALRARPAL